MVRSRISADPDAVLGRVVESFMRRQVGFVWVAHPSAYLQPLVEVATGMTRDLDDLPSPPLRDDVRFQEVLDGRAMTDCTDLIFGYSEVPEASRALVAQADRYWVPQRTPVVRWVVYDSDDRPIGKILLSVAAVSPRT